MAKRVADLVEEMANPIISNLGYELVEVKYSKTNNGMVLTLFIYSDKGITLQDCEIVSKSLDVPLDELNPTNDESYTLNVSSLGIDRPIKCADDCRRNLGTEVEVKLYAPLNNKKLYTGFLCDYNDSGFSIKEEDGSIQVFDFNKVAGCVPVIKF